jgi:hypothetical protein
MPRKNKGHVLTICAWPKMIDGKCCRGSVKTIHIDKTRTPHRLHVVIENIDPDQHGRMHALDFPLPLHPGDRTARFLLACGIHVGPVGTTISIDGAINTVLLMRFRGAGAGGLDEFDFEPITGLPGAKSAIAQEPENGDAEARPESDRIAAGDPE